MMTIDDDDDDGGGREEKKEEVEVSQEKQEPHTQVVGKNKSRLACFLSFLFCLWVGGWL